jgi:hypothetical protein
MVGTATSGTVDLRPSRGNNIAFPKFTAQSMARRIDVVGRVLGETNLRRGSGNSSKSVTACESGNVERSFLTLAIAVE